MIQDALDAVRGQLMASRPLEWLLVFRRDPVPKRWVRWLNGGGEFSHVLAMAYVAPADAWLVYDVSLLQTRIAVVPDFIADGTIGAVTDGAAVVRVVAPVVERRGWRPRLGFWCVPAMAHLVGIRSSALRPDGFFRDCLAQGGVVIAGGADHGLHEKAGGGPGAGSPARCGA